MPEGGYDSGYRCCSCFWGREPGTLVKKLEKMLESLAGLVVLDAGCGEGKNAAYLASRGARVRAVDISVHALNNAQKAWHNVSSIDWERCDIRETELPLAYFDVVIAYGVLHCLQSPEEIELMVGKLQASTKEGGYNLICSLNDRYQELAAAHPGFNPCLVRHGWLVKLYRDWSVLEASDSDLEEYHPHNLVKHMHSVSRLIARKLS